MVSALQESQKGFRFVFEWFIRRCLPPTSVRTPIPPIAEMVRFWVPTEHKIHGEDIVILPLMSCLPPTSVGGQRSRTLFLEPAEAGSRVSGRSSNHQLKLVANRNICLCVSRFMRNIEQRWTGAQHVEIAFALDDRQQRSILYYMY